MRHQPFAPLESWDYRAAVQVSYPRSPNLCSVGSNGAYPPPEKRADPGSHQLDDPEFLPRALRTDERETASAGVDGYASECGSNRCDRVGEIDE